MSDEEGQVSSAVEKAMTHFYKELSRLVEAKAKRYEAVLRTLTEAAVPLDMWHGGLRKEELSSDERRAFADAVCAAMLLVQSAGTTSGSTQSPASPDDSVPSAHAESADPGSC